MLQAAGPKGTDLGNTRAQSRRGSNYHLKANNKSDSGRDPRRTHMPAPGQTNVGQNNGEQRIANSGQIAQRSTSRRGRIADLLQGIKKGSAARKWASAAR